LAAFSDRLLHSTDQASVSLDTIAVMRHLSMWRPVLLGLVVALSVAAPTPSLAQSATLAGKVVDTSGGAIVGARVSVHGQTGPDARVTSDADGTFAVTGLSFGDYEVRVEKDLFNSTQVRVTISASAPAEPLRIALTIHGVREEISVVGHQSDSVFAPDSPKNPFRVPLSSASTLQVITKDQIQAMKPVSVFDLANNTTGAFSTSSGKKGFTGARIRGDSNLVWIVDGAYLPSQVAGRILQALPVGTIEQMEVIRGSSTLTLAPMVGFSNPSGSPTDGFIVIRTSRATRTNGSARFAFESNTTPAGHAHIGTTFGSPRTTGTSSLGYASATISYFQTDGPSDRLSNGHGYNVSRRSGSVMAKAGVNQGLLNVDATYFHDRSRFQVPNSNLVARTGIADNWEMQPSRTDLLSINGNLAWHENHATLFSLSHNRSHQKLNGAGSVANLNFEDGGLINDNRTTHINLRQVSRLAGNRVSAGGDVMLWHTPTGQNSYEGIERKERITGLFAQLERTVAGRLALDGSVRRDRVLILKGVDYFTGGAQPPQPPPFVQDRTLAPAVFATVGGRLTMAARIAVLGRAGYSQQGDANVNPTPGTTLDPETQSKFEAGIEARLHRRFTATVTAFHRGVANEKSIAGYSFTRVNGTNALCATGTIPATGPTSAATSLQACYAQSDTTRDGVEVVGEGTWLTQGRVRASVTRMTRLEDSANQVQITTPRTIADLMVSQDLRVVSAMLTVKRISAFAGRRPAGGADTAFYPLGAYTKLDASVSRLLTSGTATYRLSLYGRNLGDVRFQTVAGFPDVGRVIGADLTLGF